MTENKVGNPTEDSVGTIAFDMPGPKRGKKTNTPIFQEASSGEYPKKCGCICRKLNGNEITIIPCSRHR